MFITAIIFIAILGLLVFIHELGHYTVARWIGVHVEEFGFGLPPRIWGKQIGKTIYSINWLPIGGFVKLAGEDDAQQNQNPKSKIQNQSQYFWARSKKERAAILLAGVTMNFLLAVAITAFLLGQGIFEPSGRVHVEKVVTGSPAANAGLQKDDLILSVASAKKTLNTLKIPKELIDFTNGEKGNEVHLAVSRGGVLRTVVLIPRVVIPKGEGPMGVAVSDLEKHAYPISEAPIKALKINLNRAVEMFTGLGSMVAKLIQRKPVGADVAGPIGIAQVTGEAVKFGWMAVLEFMSILSLNLAVLNILPIPALDGGRLLFIVIEKLTGKKVNSAFERTSHQIGMLVLMVLVVLISINDIMRLARGGS